MGLRKYDIFDTFKDFIPWTSVDGFICGGNPGYNITARVPHLYIKTGSTLNDFAYLYSWHSWPNLVDTGRKVTLEFAINYLSSIANQNIWFRLAPTTSTPYDTFEHFGWKIIDGDLYASNAYGLAQSLTDTDVDLAVGYQRTRLKIIFKPGSWCKFFVDDVLEVTHATNLPQSNPYYLHFVVQTLEAASKILYIGRVLIEKEHA